MGPMLLRILGGNPVILLGGFEVSHRCTIPQIGKLLALAATQQFPTLSRELLSGLSGLSVLRDEAAQKSDEEQDQTDNEFGSHGFLSVRRRLSPGMSL